MIEYELSNRQRSLLQNGVNLQIAIPITPGIQQLSPVSELVDRVPELAELRMYRIHDVFVSTVWANLLQRSNREQGTLESYVGAIVDKRHLNRVSAAYQMPVLIARVLGEGAASNDEYYPPRWPGGKVTNIVPADYQGV